MARILKLVAVTLTVILIPLLLVAGVYGFAYWKVTEAADNFAQQLSPFATMSYQSVHIDLLATEVGINNISLEPVGSQGQVLIEAVRMQAPSWAYFLDFENQINSGVLPETLNVNIQGLIVDLQSGYMNKWASQAADVQAVGGQSYDALACGNRSHFSLADLKGMRYSSVKSDMSLLYYFDPNNQTLNFDLDTSTSLMMNVSAEVEIAVATDDLNMQTLMFAQPMVKRFDVRYKDKGYNKRRMIFCAKETGQSEPEYRAMYKQALQQQLASQGWQIPEETLTQYDKINNPAGSVYLRIEHPQGLGAQSMMLVQKPSDLITVLNPYVELNGKPVSLDGISWKLPEPEKQVVKVQEAVKPPVQKIEQVLAETPKKAEVKKTPKVNSFAPPPVKSFKQVPVSTLKNHIGQKVKLFTYFGRDVEGTLISTNNSVIKVEHRLVDGRGTAIYPIALDKIQTAKLYH
ncbi:MAG: hypothetical protein K6L74_03890 [Neptuniibacter sp.]